MLSMDPCTKDNPCINLETLILSLTLLENNLY